VCVATSERETRADCAEAKCLVLLARPCFFLWWWFARLFAAEARFFVVLVLAGSLVGGLGLEERGMLICYSAFCVH
jgi:hypothetical protein